MRCGVDTAKTEYKGYTLIEVWDDREDCNLYGCAIYKDGKFVEEFNFEGAFQQAMEYVDKLNG